PIAARDLVVDPACGDGRWLAAVARRAPGARLVGVDADPLAIDSARVTLAAAGVEADLRLGDALADDALVPHCDWGIGTPPFVRPQPLPRAEARALWSRFSLATDKCDLSACFVQRALERAPRFALVLPAALLSLASWGAVRAAVARRGIGAVHPLPGRTFAAGIDSVVVVADPGDERIACSLGAEGPGPVERLAVGATWSVDGEPLQLEGRPLGELASFHMGVVCGDYERYVHLGRGFDEDRPTCRGRDVGRWTIGDRGE